MLYVFIHVVNFEAVEGGGGSCSGAVAVVVGGGGDGGGGSSGDFGDGAVADFRAFSAVAGSGVGAGSEGWEARVLCG
jgi:hypothetical protein